MTQALYRFEQWCEGPVPEAIGLFVAVAVVIALFVMRYAA